jgi:16S rRNA (cytosine1402-N4)-methyltransferase
MTREHIPVALQRCLELLTPAIESSLRNSAETYVLDATLGLGGHARALLEKFPTLIVIGIDRDESAIAIARERVAPFQDRLLISHTTYEKIDEVLAEHGVGSIAGALFDLGVSSMQLDDGERGFAYSHDAPLDMRMDQSSGLTALDVLNTYEHGALVRILRSYGEEKFAPRIADFIIEARTSGNLNSTKELAELVKAAIQELSILEKAIPAALAALKIEGRLVAMAYQSLEDKIVKSALASVTESRTPRGLPVDLPDSAAKYKLIMSGSESASDAEIVLNPRAQSMRLRAVERLAA